MGTRVTGFRCCIVLALASCHAGAVRHAEPVRACAALGDTRPARAQQRACPLGPPADCIRVPADEPLQASIARAPAGATLCLEPGTHRGPAVIDEELHLWGTRDAVILSSGVGTTVELRAARASIEGVTIDGSGTRYDLDDAAIKIHADDVRVENVRIVHATFGILGEQITRAEIRGNEVVGSPDVPFGLRGDAIRLWEGTHSTVADNVVTNGRDLVLWYSSHNRFLRNRVTGSRYGTHLMYSHDNEIRGNAYRDDVVGIFVMYSRDLRIEDNELVGMSGSAGMGIGLKEAGNVALRGNRYAHDTIGIYVDTSPLSVDDHDTAIGEELSYCDTAILFHGRADRNTFRDLVLRDNRRQVASDGGDDATAASWDRNYYDDYAGYDLDGDGFGDVPYAERSLATDVVDRRPALAFFTGTPALGVVDAIGRLVPLFSPKTLLVDAHPRMSAKESRRAH